MVATRNLKAVVAPKLSALGALGQPPGTPSAAENGAGVLTGTYQYAYTEQDGSGGGETVISAVASITVASKTVRVTVPPPRRGVDRRKLYRTAAGGSVFKLVHDFGGGSGYFQTQWDDNTPDVALGATAPAADTTALYGMSLNQGVKTFVTHPDQGAAAADLTILTGSSGYAAGAWAIDAYGSYYGRTYLGNTFSSEKTGVDGSHFQAFWQDVLDGGPALASVLRIMPKGSLVLTPQTLSDPGLADGMGTALSIAATAPTVPTATVIANNITVTGAGSAAFSQTAFLSALAAGYTGPSATYASRNSNLTASTGPAFGAQSSATGAAALNIGVAALATGGTKNIGVFGSSAGVDLAVTALTFPSGVTGIAGAFSNGSNSDDIIVGFDNLTPVFRVTNNGGIVAEGLAANTSTSYDFATAGKGNFRILANGNTDVQIGSTNNVPVLVKTNATLAATVGTDQSWAFANQIRVGGTAGPLWRSGTGSPEGVVTAPVGSLYTRTDGGAGTTLYVKESGAGNTGWIAK